MADGAGVLEVTANAAQREADERRGVYKLKVTAFALLGYAVIFTLLFVVCALVGGILGVAVFSTPLFLLLLKKKALFVLLPVIWVLARALWVKFDRPAGFELQPAHYPELFAQIETLRRTLDAPRVHQVLLTGEFNAAICQTPRLGVFGWQHNTLIIGLELLLAMSPEQARAVLAHELGHLSGNHSRFAGWIYRVRASWYRIMNQLDGRDAFGVRWLARFFNWYAPRFSAYSFVLARQNEFEADAISAELTSVSDAGAALVTSSVCAAYLDERYWSEFFRGADQAPAPAILPWSGLRHFLGEDAPRRDDLEQRLARALEICTTYDDTHPSLSDRLQALGAEPSLPLAMGPCAAHAWLGAGCDEVIAQFDADWLSGNAEAWRERFEYVRAMHAKLADYSARRVTELSDEDLWDFAMVSEEFRSAEDALPLFDEYQRREPNDPDVAFVRGRILARLGKIACIEQLHSALARPSLAVEACQIAYWFLSQRDCDDQAAAWMSRAQQISATQEAAAAERMHLGVDDALRRADLGTELAVQLVATLKAHPRVAKAWLVEKVVEYDPDTPAYAVVVAGKWFRAMDSSLQAVVGEDLAEDFDVWVVGRNEGPRKLAKQIMAVGDRVV
ncbi:MAG: M48 family metalloprotease [Gammaproteobacteria bacterium]|nr:M48 family metalloprotease [Gammaproteobacteria bacterium]